MISLRKEKDNCLYYKSFLPFLEVLYDQYVMKIQKILWVWKGTNHDFCLFTKN